MGRPTASALLAVACLALALPVAGQAESGHCLYKQYAPKLRLWYPACQMPAESKADCEKLISATKAQVEYAEGECSTSGVTAICALDGARIFFYQGKDTDLQRGCEGFLRGAWRPDLVPARR